MARKEEVMRFTQRISMGERGKMECLSRSLKARPMRRRMTCAMLEMRRCRRNLGFGVSTTRRGEGVEMEEGASVDGKSLRIWKGVWTTYFLDVIK
jgi:hypothetical protein